VPCAVKFIVDEAMNDPATRARFDVEARTIAQLQSPHVVRIFDHGTHEDVPYIALELLNGEDLGGRLERFSQLDREATYRIVSQVARGLSRAHAAGIVHRDLKPENVFLAEEDGDEVAKLLDFGIVKSTSYPDLEPGGETGGLFGTPEYMSPEQARGAPEIDHRSDLWSLAVIAYECLTGRLPFEAPSLSGILMKITSEPIPVPSEVGDDIPPAFDAWWARATSRDVAGRFQSAQQLADALGEALGVIDVPATLRLSPIPFCRAAPVRRKLSRSPAAAAVFAAVPLFFLLFTGVHATRKAHAAMADTHAQVAAASWSQPATAPPSVALSTPVDSGASVEALELGQRASKPSSRPVPPVASVTPRRQVRASDRREPATPPGRAPAEQVDFGI
jgi:serine/threonine-protein kinase